MKQFAKATLSMALIAGLSGCSDVSEAAPPPEITRIAIGVKKGPVTVLSYDETAKAFTGKTVTGETDANYLRFTSPDTLFSLHPNALRVSNLSDKSPAVLTPVTEAKAGRGPTAVETSDGDKIVFTAHFPDAQLTARKFDGKTLSKPQTFACGEAHQFRAHPNQKFAYAACRKNTLRQFSIHPNTGKVKPLRPAKITVPGGPRHLDFHPAGDTLYLLLELSSEVAVFDINADTGALIEPPRQVIPTTNDGSANRSSDIHITPNGRFVYAFNRVNQDMAVFRVAPDRSLIRELSVPMGKGEVRDWAMAPGGDYIITASNKGHIGVWDIDRDTGALTLSAEQTDMGNAVSVAIID